MRGRWDQRNADHHGRTKAATNHAIRHERLLGQLSDQYAQVPQLLAQDRDLFSEPLQKKLERHPASLELWLKRVIPVVKRSRQDASAAIRRTHHRITDFFRGTKPSHALQLEHEPPDPLQN